MPGAGLTADIVIARGAQLLEAHPTDELTLASLATSLGVRVPSLYKHIDGLPGLRRGIMLRVKVNLSAALVEACVGRARDDAVRSLAAAYRTWARQHPAQYPMTVRAPGPDDVEDQQASDASLQVVYRVLAGYHLLGDDAIDATRFLRAVIHGFVSLETAGAFTLAADLERSYDKTVTSVVTALENWKHQ
ncbi:transcriptional regulator, TetR family [Micromonospora matsumotoense]|uniref:Transcriptional regulator, TetR family n=1 Tax=Micromonospora matsumotoense TaxID=121616 RepID=A0A1C4X2P3_9ACTN|nr:TetR-like C-terminal domain-containing protein [Micromonospora matsumotoense]SCF02757.1 transcriptional regulator, TetR family [Micromonospora matsumotoense]